MAKVVCPHCQAVNQDVELDDPCWKCGTILGAPASAIDTGVGAPASDVNPANSQGSSEPKIQKQIEREQPVGTPAPSERPKTSSTNVAVVFVVVAILAIAIVAAILLLRPHA